MAKTTQSQTLSLLLFIWLLMNISPTSGKSSTMQVHPKQSTTLGTATATTTTTMTTITVSTDGTGTSTRQNYGEALHEVPSGANPESNR
ncbi:unnamed protein product [Withania somnifera]